MATDRPLVPALRAFAAARRAFVPTYIWGAPGQGKTARCTALADAWKSPVVETLIASLREPSDFQGLPTETAGATAYLPPAFARRLVTAGGGDLILDELNTAPRPSRAAALRVIQEKVVGDLPLPAETVITALSNPIEYAENGQEISAAMANRFMHLEWDPDPAEWLEGIVVGFENLPVPPIEEVAPTPSNERIATIRVSVQQFIKSRMDLLNVPPRDLADQVRGWPSNRSWDNLARVLPWVAEGDDDAALLACTGLVGEEAGSQFFAYLRAFDLISPMEALADPTLVDAATARPDQLFALSLAVQSMLSLEADVAKRDDLLTRALALFEHIARVKPDVVQPTLMSILATMHLKNPNVALTEEQASLFGEFLQDLGMLRSA